MILTILQHVPLWVYGLLAALVAYGISQSRAQRLPLRRSVVMPVVLLALSLAGAVSAFGGTPPALLAWAAGVAAALVLLHGRVDVSGVQYSAAEQAFTMPGSWWPLVLMLGIFAIKFAAGLLLARQPALRSALPVAAGFSAAYGLFSGVFLGRAMALWTLLRRPATPLAA